MFKPIFTADAGGHDVTLALRGTLQQYYAARAVSIPKVVTLTVRAGARRTRDDLRRQIRNKFGDQKRGSKNPLEKAIRQLDFPKRGYSLTAKSIVYSKAVYKPNDGLRSAAVDLVTVFTTSGTVRARGGSWLAIPTDRAPRTAKGRRATPRESGLDLVFLKIDENKAVLVGPGKTPVVYYILRKQSHRVSRIDIATAVRKGNARMPAALKTIWERENRRLMQNYGRGLETGIVLQAAE